MDYISILVQWDRFYMENMTFSINHKIMKFPSIKEWFWDTLFLRKIDDESFALEKLDVILPDEFWFDKNDKVTW